MARRLKDQLKARERENLALLDYAAALDDRLTAIEKRLAKLEGKAAPKPALVSKTVPAKKKK